MIGVLTSARADFGILRSLLQALNRDRRLALRVYVTGSHLEPRYGKTGDIVVQEFRSVTRKVKTMRRADSLRDAAATLGRGAIEFARVFEDERPDILVMVGDRFEILGPAGAAVLFGIPIAHIHGGERTDGAVDEFIRHAVTKLSTFHFTTTERYRRRVVQMGEQPDRVWNVGAPGLDQIKRAKLLSRTELARRLGINLEKPTAISTFHPETRSDQASCREMLKAIEKSGIQCIFSAPNADPGNGLIARELRDVVRRHPDRFVLVHNLGTESYLSAIKHCGVMIGNSSSGLIEAPSLGAAVVNIGERQAGRERSRHVIDVPLRHGEIERAIKRAFSPRFRESLRRVLNPYDAGGKGSTGARIKRILLGVSLEPKPPFYDLPESHT